MMLRATLILITLFIGTNAVAAEHPDECYRQGKYKEAMSGYEKLDLDHPKDITYRFNRGCAAYQLKDYQRAQAAFSSVCARAQDNSMRFKAAYNLGNTAFQAGDLQTAVQYYKEALSLNTQDTDTRYNLELTLRKIELAKKEQDQNQQQGGSETQKQDKKDQPSQQGQQQPPGKEGKQNQPPQQDQQSPEGQQGQGRQDQTQAQPPPGEQETAGRQEPQDLSGELKAASPAPQQEGAGDQAQPQPAPSVERQKADALLDNIQEDRTRYLQLQVPEDKRDGVKSGKFW
jgi:Ca-activated chloride channel homolog